jgi:hypothetical protein
MTPVNMAPGFMGGVADTAAPMEVLCKTQLAIDIDLSGMLYT